MGSPESVELANIRRSVSAPLYRRLVTHPDELAMVVSKVRPEDARLPGEDPAPVDFVNDLTAYISEQQDAGAVTGTDPAVVVGALRTVLLVPLHADEFGDTYPAVLDLAIDALTAGLAPGPAAG